MKIKKIILNILLLLFINTNTFSDEIVFESSDLEIKNNGNIIFAKETYVKIPNKKINIKSKKAEYYKSKKIIIFKDDVYFEDLENKIEIFSNEITYNENKNIIFSNVPTKIYKDNKFKIKTTDILYDRNQQKIYSQNDGLIEDDKENIYELKNKFTFDLNDEVIKSKKSIITDKNKNEYIFEDIIINIKKNEIIGKEIQINFEDSYFGNEKNDPVLKGRAAISNENELRLYKAVFSTCNIENKNCRGWELNSEEFNHDKNKKIFEYKNSWIKLFDKKVFYLPYFNHPDPSVKRKSGFLTPSYSTSDNLGTSINFPYFKVIDIDKDITFKPMYYADKSFLLQNEYRQAFEKSNLLTDFSFLIGSDGTKGHFFYNQIGKTNFSTNYELNLQTVKGDSYLKSHSLLNTSPLIKSETLLTSNLDLGWEFSDSKLDTSFKIYEDLSRNYHDRYQYIFPDFNFLKKIDIPENYNGSFDFNSYGSNKYYNTNVIESVITNDFLFSSMDFINSNGYLTNYNFLLKNSNNYSNNPKYFENNTQYDLFGVLKIDTSLPLQKKFDEITHYLKPIVSLRYSPNSNSDLSAKDILLNYDSVFNLNRIGTNTEVEGGESLSLGLEFKRKDISGLDIIDFKVANVLKKDQNKNLPSKSRLDQKRSDIFGNLDYKINQNINIGYDFSYDNNLKHSNLEKLDLDLILNNLFTNFSYYHEDNDLGSKESLMNTSNLNIDEENKLSFEISKNLKDNFTEYYNLIYGYETDCLTFNLSYNKSFYRDGNLDPNKSISFLIKIVPFTELGVSNIDNL